MNELEPIIVILISGFLIRASLIYAGQSWAKSYALLIKACANMYPHEQVSEWGLKRILLTHIYISIRPARLDRRFGGRWGSHLVSLDLNWSHLISHGLTWSHLVSLGLTWSHLVSLGLTWFHLVSLGLPCFHLFSLGLTWSRLVSLLFHYDLTLVSLLFCFDLTSI